METFYAFISGVVLGCVLMYLIVAIMNHRRVFGTIRFYQLDPNEEPILTAELDKSVEEFRKNTHVIFRVSHN